MTIIRYGLTTRRSILLALAFAFALMAKFNLAFALPLVELALIIAVWPQRDWRGFIKANLFIVLFVALIAGWWFVRNTQLYGEPTGVQRMNELWGGRNPAESLGLAISEIPYAWSSFWGRFGYGQIPLPDAIYTGALIVSLIGLVGLIIAFVRKQFDRIQIKQLVLVIFSALLFAAALFGYMLSSTAGPMGRFYFPGLSAFGLLLALGWTTLFNLYARLVTRYSLLVTPFRSLLSPSPSSPSSATLCPLTPRHRQLMSRQFLNRSTSPSMARSNCWAQRSIGVSAQPGDPIKVTLYWRALAIH